MVAGPWEPREGAVGREPAAQDGMKAARLRDIADLAGVSPKTVSGALHGGTPRLSAETRARVQGIAAELGYVPNLAARAVRQGWMPIVGLVADGLITSPFASELMRAMDNGLRAADTSVVVTSVGSGRRIEAGLRELARLRPRAIAYAAMFHHEIVVPDEAGMAFKLMINCRDAAGRCPSLVPDERQAGRSLADHLAARGRRRLAFLDLPGLIAGRLRAQGLREGCEAAGIAWQERWHLPATRGQTYSELARSLVREHVGTLLADRPQPDAIVCGNDRIALEVYGALARHGCGVPTDMAVVGFDNQVDIAARLDPPLTTMALPYRAMGRRAAAILLGQAEPSDGVELLPFRLVQRGST